PRLLSVSTSAGTSNSMTFTVNSGAASVLSIETAADGTGTPVSAQNIASAASTTAYAIVRDSFGNFVANVAASWSIAHGTGGVANSDLIVPADNKSAVFTGHLVGSAQLSATANS